MKSLFWLAISDRHESRCGFVARARRLPLPLLGQFIYSTIAQPNAAIHPSGVNERKPRQSRLGLGATPPFDVPRRTLRLPEFPRKFIEVSRQQMLTAVGLVMALRID